MRSLPLLALLGILSACDDKGNDTGGPTGDGGSGDGGSGDGGSGDGGADEEICDGVDNDGDGEVDEGVTTTFYADADADGYGDPLVSDELCEAVEGWVLDMSDCDDTNAEVSPAAVEVYDGVDNDCNDAVDDMPHWSYEDGGEHIGPSEWAEYWPDCGGDAQSPIDFDVSAIVYESLPRVAVNYAMSTVSAVNNGHTVKWTVNGGSTLSLDGTTWALDQIHFHAGAEHTVMGERYPLEAHLVHKDDKGTDSELDDAYLVIGVFIIESTLDDGGTELAVLSDMGFGSLPAEEEGTLVDKAMSFDPGALLDEVAPGDEIDTVRYDGSFTTPPCTEGVQWVMFNEVLFAPADQIAQFTDLYDANYREPQDLNDRSVVADFDF
jgi:carbonic anhydrase